MTEPRYVAVVLPVPVNRPYIYAVPDALAERVRVGARVLVPLRGRKAVGIVTEAVSRQPAAGVSAKSILAVPDDQPALSPALLQLGRWISDYYGAPLGLALRAILPGPLWSVARPAGPAPREERLFVLAGNGGALGSLLERERLFKRAPKRRAAYETVEALGGSAPVKHLVERLRLSRDSLNQLVRQGLARFERVPEMRDPFATLTSPPPPELTVSQREVVAGIAATPVDTPVLIHGVTGSGKTLVYLDVLRRVVASGNGAILLVPEISLTPQTVARVRGVFGDQVAVLHSGLSDGERADAWRALRSGVRRVAVGPRSAVFAPVQRLGAIVVDEEHEPSYKQGSAPRYHTRDVAVMRAQLEGARLILGSATPSLETLTDDRVVTFALPNRVGARPLPPVEIVDLRSAPRVPPAETGVIPWSEALDAAIAGALERNEQVILLLNRRGFATFVQCPACGNVPGCPQCAIALTVHQTPPALRCHYCGHEEAVPETCSICGSATQRLRGLGTQQLEHFVGSRYPRARIARMDLDTTTSKWAHHHILERVERGEVNILLGTQMIAKGLDFPNVTVVGVVDADTGLHFPDFRAGERTFQLVAQVAGRAGRGPKGGRVFVQTRAPDHHAIRAAAAHSVEQFAALELPLRAPPHPSYPPRTGLVRFVIAAGDHSRTAELAEKVAAWLRRASTERLDGALGVLGPAPCPIMRLKGKWRWHVLAKSAEARVLGRVVRAWRANAFRGGEVIVDRDPVSLL